MTTRRPTRLRGAAAPAAGHGGGVRRDPGRRAGRTGRSREFLVFAKIPGLRADLLDYTRPTGAVADFGGSWPNWVVLARPDPDSIPPAPVLYDNAGYQVVDVPAGTELGGGAAAPRRGLHGHVRRRGLRAAPAGLPGRHRGPGHGGPAPAAAAGQVWRRRQQPVGRAAAPCPGRHRPGATGRLPAGRRLVWEVMLDYAARHPRDPRAPEALHWLIHVGHYGQSHNHSGRRAFRC